LKRIGESERVVLHQTHREVYVVRERSTQEKVLKNAWEKGAYSDGRHDDCQARRRCPTMMEEGRRRK
jgi:hypothetical protein